MPSGTPVQIRLDDTEREALDRYRREQNNPPTRARALRGLIRDAFGLGISSLGANGEANPSQVGTGT